MAESSVATIRLAGIRWLAAAAVAWWACANAVLQRTPIDSALPFVAVVIVLLAWMARATPAAASAVLCGVPALLTCGVALPDERARLLAYGAVVAASFCGAVLARTKFAEADSGFVLPYAGFATCGVAILRWIARDHVEIVREAFVVLGCIAVIAAFGRRQSPLSVAVALFAAMVTPALPARTLAIPFGVALLVLVSRLAVRTVFVQRDHGDDGLTPGGVVGILPLALMLMLFAWSGAAARALPVFWRGEPSGPRQALNYALTPGESVSIDTPPHTRGLIVSMANGLRIPHGRVVGMSQPGGRPIRMGEVADWGFARREHFWTSTNSLPVYPAGTIRGYGYEAWVDGAGWVPAPSSSRITVTADPRLAPEVRLQIEAVGLEQR